MLRFWLRHLFADSVYNGPNLRDALAKFGRWTIEIVKRTTEAAGFQQLPRRWVVERTLAWLNRNEDAITGVFEGHYALDRGRRENEVFDAMGVAAIDVDHSVAIEK